MNLNELGVALLWELAHVWGITPRKVIRANGVRWLAGPHKPNKRWKRVYP